MKIYIAGPLFNTHERRYLEEIANELESAGYETFLPHRDAGLLDNGSTINRKQLFNSDLAGLEASEVVVALLTGPDHDSGTSAELGIAFASGKLCFGVTDDMRWMNNMIWGICGEGKQIVKSPSQLIPLLQDIVSTSD